MKIRGILLLVSAFVLASLLTYWRGYTGVVRFAGEEARAQVTRYQQLPASSAGRAGDWEMEYQFTTASGAVATGRATFAPNDHPPADSKEVPILYLPSAPDVSGVVGHISITGLVGYFLALYMLFVGMTFLRHGPGPPPGA